MKRILLLAVSISLFSFLLAQENTWDIYLQGQAVQSFELEGNYVWVATDSFLVRLNKLDKNISYYQYPDIPEHMQNLPVKSINLKIDNSGKIWIIRSVKQCPGKGCDNLYFNSIDTFDENEWNKIEFTGAEPIRSLAVDRENNTWILAGWPGHLYKIEQGNSIRYTPENSGLLYDYTTVVASDKSGNIWLANFGNVGDLVVGDMALIKYDGDTWTSYLSERCPIPVAISFDKQGNPWVQNPMCTRKLDTVSYSWSEQISLGLNSNYYLLTMEGENRFWFSNRRKGGISVYNGSQWSFYSTAKSELPSDTVYQIAIDSNGTKWIGTENGLAAFNENILHSSVSPDLKMMNKIALFPDPAHDFITLKMNGDIQNLTANILNIQGQTIKTFSIDSNLYQLDVSNLSPGVYLFRIKCQQNYILKKFIKQ